MGNARTHLDRADDEARYAAVVGLLEEMALKIESVAKITAKLRSTEAQEEDTSWACSSVNYFRKKVLRAVNIAAHARSVDEIVADLRIGVSQSMGVTIDVARVIRDASEEPLKAATQRQGKALFVAATELQGMLETLLAIVDG